MDNEIQVTSTSPVGGFGLYDLYSGTYLGKEVWCKKLSYGDPDGKAMMVRIPFCSLVSWVKANALAEVQAGDRHLEQAVEERPGATSFGRDSTSGTASLRLLRTV